MTAVRTDSPPAWRILVATDGSACATAAQELLGRLPLPGGTQIRLVGVAADPFLAAGGFGDSGYATCPVDQELLAAERTLLTNATAAAERRIARPGWEIVREVRVGDVSQELLRAAGEFQADLLLVGTRGLAGIQRFLLGSTARNVARHAPCPVLVARGRSGDLSRVVLAVDGSEHAARAVQLIGRLPLGPEAGVTVTHVLRPYHPLLERLEGLPGARARLEPRIEATRRQQQQDAEALVGAVCARLEAAGKKAVPAILTGHPAEELLQLAERKHAELLVAGARGASPVAETLLGSVADALLQSAPCSVLLAR